MPTIRISFWAAIACVLGAAALLHAGSLHTAFFADDYLFLDQVRDRSLWTALQAPDPLSNFLRPLSRQVWFWIVAGLSSESPFAFRVGNLSFVLLAIACLAGLTRRVAGERAALIAASIFALHYSADVAVRWASGSQDAMAVAGALAALWLFVAGRRGWAAVTLLAAAFCKEIVLLTPLIAIPLAREPRESWTAVGRRAWPLAAAVATYLVASWLVPHSRQAAQYEVQIDPVQGPLAALVHLPQVALGLEWVRGVGLHLVAPPLLPLAIVLVALLFAAREAMPRPAPGVAAGLAWGVLATVPIAVVAHLWSAYYYLFAIAGLSLAVGAALARRPIGWALAAVALLAWGSAIGRDVPGFTAPRDRWSTTSHVNREHIERANRISGTYLASLERRYPTLAPSTSIFFAGLQGAVAFQRADGPLLRWAYRDTSLRGWYHSEFTRTRYARGPALFMIAEADTLREMDPGEDLLPRVAFGLALSDALDGAAEALKAYLERHPEDDHWRWWLLWVGMAKADSAWVRAELTERLAGREITPFTGREAVLGALAVGDTARAVALAAQGLHDHPLDPGVHGLFADLVLMREPDSPDGAMLALGARAMSPKDPFAWRRWGQVQLQRDRHLEAIASLERYVQLAGGARDDDEVRSWIAALRGVVAGNDAVTVGR